MPTAAAAAADGGAYATNLDATGEMASHVWVFLDTIGVRDVP